MAESPTHRHICPPAVSIGLGNTSSGDDVSGDPLFDGLGEVRELHRAFDWSSTSLGAPSTWPISLRTTVKTLLASRHPMFLLWGPELVQTYNDAFRPSFGEGDRFRRAVGARAREFWADVWPITGPQIERVIADSKASWHENQRVPMERNGAMEEAWWTYSYSPAFDDDGRVAGVLVICHETTEIVRAQQELSTTNRELEVERSRLAYVFREAPTFLAIIRGDPLRFEYVNDAYCKLVGRTDLVGRAVFEALPEARGQGFQSILRDVMATGKPFVGAEMPIMLLTSGSAPEERILDFVYFPLVEADGTRSGVIAHGVDVTDAVRARRDVERLLAESEAARVQAEVLRTRTVGLQAVTAALSPASNEMEIANAIVEHATAVLGAVGTVVARVSARGDTLELLGANDIPDSVRDAWREFPLSAPVPLAEAVRTATPIFLENRSEWFARYPDLMPMLEAAGHHANMVLPLIVNGHAIGVLAAAFDAPRIFDEVDRVSAITFAGQCAQALDRARLFEAEREARAAAERANRAKSEFLAVMSHELRTPLNAIDGYAELMELGIRGPLTDEQRTDLARIRKSQKHLLGLINGVLNYSRVEAGALRYDVSDVGVDEVLATCEALIAPQVRAKRLVMSNAECDASVKVRADGEKVHQVVLNLLTNAVKFTDSGGQIGLSCTVRSTEVEIAVSDTGRGIAADQLSRVFEPFVQLDAQLTRTQEGVGLGLAISRDLARGMGGDLTVASTVGKGSVFSLVLPRSA